MISLHNTFFHMALQKKRKKREIIKVAKEKKKRKKGGGAQKETLLQRVSTCLVASSPTRGSNQAWCVGASVPDGLVAFFLQSSRSQGGRKSFQKMFVGPVPSELLTLQSIRFGNGTLVHLYWTFSTASCIV